MKTETLPGTGKISFGVALRGSVEVGNLGLGANRTKSEERVLIVDPAQHFFGRDGFGPVDRNEVVFAIGNALQRIHPVVRGGRGAALYTASDFIIPTGPGAPRPRHHAGVGVDGRDVGLIAEFAQQAVLV